MRKELLAKLIAPAALALVGLMVAVAALGPTRLSQYGAAHLSQDEHSHAHPRPGSGTVKGLVVNAEGEAVSGAYITFTKDDFFTGPLPAADSDYRGRFSAVLAPGFYTVAASKVEDDYPDSSSGFHSSGLSQRVEVVEDQLTSDIVVNVGSRAAKIVGQVVDASTKKPLKRQRDLQIILRRADMPDNYYATGPDVEGNFEILVPPVPFTVEVSTAGYENWRYMSAAFGTQANLLQLAPGDKKELRIHLRPIK